MPFAAMATEIEGSWNPALRPDSIPESNNYNKIPTEYQEPIEFPSEIHNSAADGENEVDASEPELPEQAFGGHEARTSEDLLERSNPIPSSPPLLGGDWNEDRIDPAWGIPSQLAILSHTNSFPAVPPLASSTAISHMLPQSQASEVLKEIDETETTGYALEDSVNNNPWGSGEADDVEGDFFSQSAPISSEVEPAPLDDEARFEEGLPLVSHENEDAPPASEEATTSNLETSDTFFGETGGDDFFATISAPQGGSSAFDPGHLERKSTEQVLSSLQGHDRDVPMPQEADKPKDEDLAALWEAALGDDDILEEDSTMDPSSFFADDGEGFLDDNEPSFASNASFPEYQAPPQSQSPSQSGSRYGPTTTTAPYAPQTQQLNHATASRPTPYASSTFSGPSTGSRNPLGAPFAMQPPIQPIMPERAQSFADKAKGGYESPYDLPMELNRPKRRPTHQNAQQMSVQSPAMPPPPPRGSSIQQSPQMSSGFAPPLSGMPYQTAPSNPSIPSVSPVVQQQQAKPRTGSFFEELPISSRPRPTSSASHVVPQTSFAHPPPPQHQMPPQMIPPRPSPQMPPQPLSAFGLVGPQRVLPFSDPQAQPTIPAQPPQPVSAPSTRYSPQPTAQPPQTSNRYTASSVTGPPRAPSVSLPFQPRTSSPLARSASASGHQYQPNPAPNESAVENESFPTGARRPSLQSANYVPQRSDIPNDSRASGRHATYHHPLSQSQIMSPDIKTNDITQQQQPQFEPAFKHPERIKPELPHANTVPSMHHQPPSVATTLAASRQVPTQPAHSRPRAPSATVTFIVPTDGQQHDPLNRWQGAPIFRFGFGANLVTSFPQRVPRYTPGQKQPVIKCTPGEVKIRTGQMLSLDDHVTSFPGPLKAKGKKKEVLDWLRNSIQRLEQHPTLTIPDYGATNSRKRFEEKVLLWKILQILVENDGALDGTPAIESTVRSVLSPELASQATDGSTPYQANAGLGITSLTTSNTDPAAIEILRKLLHSGEREKAVWHAVDAKLWGHAMLIGSTLPRETWKRVAQEFVRLEVRSAGENTESLAALYDVFAGNWEECVDQLVPPSARAGLQMVNKSADGAPVKNALDGLDRWRETLSLILSNRSVEDARSLVSLGQLLLTYGRVEAAHICFMFSKIPTLCAGADDPQAGIVLLGADHRHQPLEYAKDVDSVLLTEIYEFANAVLSPSTALSGIIPHLQVFKFQHAMVLAENGHRDEAQQYCDAIGNSIKSTTKGSSYYHANLFNALDDLAGRLRQAPKDGTGSWISKPSMDKVSGSVWNKFTQFVAGDDSDSASVASARGEVDGPFARISEDAPIISRGPSPSDPYGGYVPSALPAAPVNSRYAPSGPYAPRGSLDQSSYAPTSQPNSPPETFKRGSQSNHQHGYQPSALPYTPEEKSLPTPPVAGNEIPPQVPFKTPFSPPKSATHFSPPPSQPSMSRPGTGNGSPTQTSIREQMLSPMERSFSNEPSPVGDRYSPMYQPRSATSGSYQPRSASYEPRSYQASPLFNQMSPRPPTSDSYEPQIRIEPETPRITTFSSDSPISPADAKSVPLERGVSTDSGYQPSTASSYGGYQPASGYEPSSGYQPPSASIEPPSAGVGSLPPGYGPPTPGYEPPSSSGYAPPSYDPETNGGTGSPPKSPRKKKSFMNLSDDEVSSASKQAAEKERKDREAAEAFRRAAEADAQRDAQPALTTRRSGWLGGWFGGARGQNGETIQPATAKGPIKARLGEESSFYFDKDLKKWVNKKGGETPVASAPTPPPPRGPPSRAVSATGPTSSPRPPNSNSMGPPSGPPSRRASPHLAATPEVENDSSNEGSLVPPPLVRPPSLAPGAGPPSRPGTGMSGMSNASSRPGDDFLGDLQPRKGGTVKKNKKGRGYIDVMAK